MDFIELLFGFAPDGGDGTFELLLVAAPILVCALIWHRFRNFQRS
jgi:hypothetical protein